MQISNNNFNLSYGSAKDITLKYVMEKRQHLLPQTMIKKINEIFSNGQGAQPTLRQLHQDTYAPLLECKTLDEAKKMFPEFQGMKELNDEFARSNKFNYKTIREHINLEEFPLYLLQETWAKLQNQDDIAKGLGLKARGQLDSIKQRIGFVNRDKNYTTLLKSSDPELNEIIAAKTRAFNNANPEQMYAHNSHAAQFCKTAEYRDAQSKRMLEYDKNHPERKQKIKTFNQEAWDRLPDVKKQMREFAQNFTSERTRMALRKDITNPQSLTETQKRMIKIFYSKFWKKYPEAKIRLSEVRKQVAAERKK